MSTAQTLVRDVMSKPLVTISPDATLVEAARRMRSEAVSALLVPTTELAIVTKANQVCGQCDVGHQNYVHERDRQHL